MAYKASYIDFKRIQKNAAAYSLSHKSIEAIFSSGFMTISSNDCLSFCYPVRYWDGILIRYYTSDIENSIDMLIDLSYMLPGRLYISGVEENVKDMLFFYGFSHMIKTYGVYKKDFSLPKQTEFFHIVDYDDKYYESMKALEEESIYFPRVTSTKELSDFTKNSLSKAKLCVSDTDCRGFCLYILKPELKYCYIVKLYTGISFRRIGIGTSLLRAVINDSEKLGYYPIFSDIFDDDSLPFLSYTGFTTWSESLLLIRPD